MNVRSGAFRIFTVFLLIILLPMFIFPNTVDAAFFLPFLPLAPAAVKAIMLLAIAGGAAFATSAAYDAYTRKIQSENPNIADGVTVGTQGEGETTFAFSGNAYAQLINFHNNWGLHAGNMYEYEETWSGTLTTVSHVLTNKQGLLHGTFNAFTGATGKWEKTTKIQIQATEMAIRKLRYYEAGSGDFRLNFDGTDLHFSSSSTSPPIYIVAMAGVFQIYVGNYHPLSKVFEENIAENYSFGRVNRYHNQYANLTGALIEAIPYYPGGDISINNTYINNPAYQPANTVITVVVDGIPQVIETADDLIGITVDNLVFGEVAGIPDAYVPTDTGLWSAVVGVLQNIWTVVQGIPAQIAALPQAIATAITQGWADLMTPPPGYIDTFWADVFEPLELKYQITNLREAMEDVYPETEPEWEGIKADFPAYNITDIYIVEPSHVNAVAGTFKDWIAGFIYIFTGIFVVRKVSTIINV